MAVRERDVEHLDERLPDVAPDPLLEHVASAALLVWEDVWATKLRDAIVNVGGEVLDLERVPYEVVNAAVEFAEAERVTEGRIRR